MSYQRILDDYRENLSEPFFHVKVKNMKKCPETSLAFASAIPSRSFTKGPGGDLTLILKNGKSLKGFFDHKRK